MALFDRFRKRDPDAAAALYEAVVEAARAEHWFLDGAVPDTLDGRFDMVAAITAIVLLRLEKDPAGAGPSVQLTERFIDDMDSQVRQIGFGDMIVGKHVGRMTAMLGGRLGAYRDGFANGALEAALVRNLYRGEPPAPDAVAHVRDSLVALRDRLAAMPIEALMAGRLS